MLQVLDKDNLEKKLNTLITLIDSTIKDLPVQNIKIYEAENLAVKMLQLHQEIARMLLQLEINYIQYKSTTECVFQSVIETLEEKTITEKKMKASVSIDYIREREGLEGIEARVSYLKVCMKIAENSHIFYRQVYSKGE